jgi:hypothetical protein
VRTSSAAIDDTTVLPLHLEHARLVAGGDLGVGLATPLQRGEGLGHGEGERLLVQLPKDLVLPQHPVPMETERSVVSE